MSCGSKNGVVAAVATLGLPLTARTSRAPARRCRAGDSPSPGGASAWPSRGRAATELPALGGQALPHHRTLTSAGRMVPWSAPRPPGARPGRPVGLGRRGPGATRLADRTGDAETRARSNSSWCREGPASVLSTGSLAPRRASLAGQTRFSSPVAATSHVGLIRDRQLCVVPSGLSAARVDP